MNANLLASPSECISELAEINNEIAKFGHLWAQAAGELKTKIKRYDRLHRAGLRALADNSDLKVAEKDAAAHVAVEDFEEGLTERIEALTGQVEEYKVAFNALERRASNAQSILSAYREEGRMNQHTAPEPSWSVSG